MLIPLVAGTNIPLHGLSNAQADAADQDPAERRRDRGLDPIVGAVGAGDDLDPDQRRPWRARTGPDPHVAERVEPRLISVDVENFETDLLDLFVQVQARRQRAAAHEIVDGEADERVVARVLAHDLARLAALRVLPRHADDGVAPAPRVLHEVRVDRGHVDDRTPCRRRARVAEVHVKNVHNVRRERREVEAQDADARRRVDSGRRL